MPGASIIATVFSDVSLISKEKAQLGPLLPTNEAPMTVQLHFVQDDFQFSCICCVVFVLSNWSTVKAPQHWAIIKIMGSCLQLSESLCCTGISRLTFYIKDVLSRKTSKGKKHISGESPDFPWISMRLCTHEVRQSQIIELLRRHTNPMPVKIFRLYTPKLY